MKVILGSQAPRCQGRALSRHGQPQCVRIVPVEKEPAVADPLTIRPATLKDADAICRIYNQGIQVGSPRLRQKSGLRRNVASGSGPAASVIR